VYFVTFRLADAVPHNLRTHGNLNVKHGFASTRSRGAQRLSANITHALFVQNADWPLEKLLRSWKSFTSRRINSLLGREGSLWQRDYFDQLVRDEKHFSNCVRYIRRNPAKAHLHSGEYILYETELA
jgi:hypothetical protein